MFEPRDTLSLSYQCDFGCFIIRPDKHRAQLFNLLLIRENQDRVRLGEYCSISDAFNAVSRQETGYLEWDQLKPHELPYRIHNIACWKFEQNVGTFPQEMCS